MNNWPADPTSLQNNNNNNHAAFGASTDPSMAFLHAPNTVDPSHFQNQRFITGAGSNGSPAFHNPVYQVEPVIPSKRPREDGLATSPRQAPGNLAGPRSQTPGQASYMGYNPAANGTPQFPNAPTPYHHLLNVPASNATPSPTPQHMNFSQAAGPQRVSTASPNAFSPHQRGPQISPSHAEHFNRGGTPGENPPSYMQPSGYGPANGMPQFSAGVNNMASQMSLNAQHGMNPQLMQRPSLTAPPRAYQMQIQEQARQAQSNIAQGRPMSGGMNMPGAQMPNPPKAAMQSMQQQMGMEDFIKGLEAFMGSRGQTVNSYPVICERRLNVLHVFSSVLKHRGSAYVNNANLWPSIAQLFHFSPSQLHQAAHELRLYWMNNLAPYESVWQQRQEKRSQMQHLAAQTGAQNQMRTQMSPSRNGLPPPGQAMQNHQRNPSDASTVKMNGAIPTNIQQAQMNGYMPPPQLSEQETRQQGLAQHKANLSQQLDAPQTNGLSAAYPPPSVQKRPDTASEKKMEVEPGLQMPPKLPIEDPFKPDVFAESRLHGPIQVDEMLALPHQVLDVKPVVPTFRELGVIDIHALIMGIKSGMHAEIRVALDTLTIVSVEQGLQLSLENCDDLVESLIDCAQEQVDFLEDNVAEVSDEMLISSYEDVIRGCRMENESLQDIPKFGSLDYDLDRAVDRLICITTLIRNFSFYESNFGMLGIPEVVKFLSNVIRCIGTKETFLRTNRNTLDFMKDVIIYLSNLSHSIQLPGKDEALCLLHFLLSFAPCPPPCTGSSDKITFTMYNPNIHKYTPSAVDSLAKLLARDEPNRTYYKSIFAADTSSTPPYELLTRTFALAISPLPVSPLNLRPIVEARKPFLLQGMLAADILSNLAPGSDHILARSWLESSDGFAVSLLRLVGVLSAERPPQHSPQRHPPGRGPPESDPSAYGAITHRAMAVLKRLVERARSGDTADMGLPFGVLPKKETLLGALVMNDVDPHVLRQLCIYAALDD